MGAAPPSRSDLRDEQTPGWVQLGGRLGWTRVDTVQGAIRRGAELVARCKTGQCTRRVKVDLQAWVRMGFPTLALADVRAAYRCGLVCGLQWEVERYPRGAPLMLYADEATARVVVSCRACRAVHSFRVVQFVEAITTARTGDCNTPGEALGPELVRGDCRGCGRHAWQVAFLRTPASSDPASDAAEP